MELRSWACARRWRTPKRGRCRRRNAQVIGTEAKSSNRFCFPGHIDDKWQNVMQESTVLLTTYLPRIATVNLFNPVLTLQSIARLHPVTHSRRSHSFDGPGFGPNGLEPLVKMIESCRYRFTVLQRVDRFVTARLNTPRRWRRVKRRSGKDDSTIPKNSPLSMPGLNRIFNVMSTWGGVPPWSRILWPQADLRAIQVLSQHQYFLSTSGSRVGLGC